MRKVENGVGRMGNEESGAASGRGTTRLCPGVLGVLALALFLGGCASGPTPKEKLATAYKELESPTPNYAEMIEASDAYLK